MTDLPIRAAATVILARKTATGPQILMGQRGAGAVFMPSKYVFPGGAVDAADADVPLATPLAADQAALLAAAPGPQALAAAAIRELWEETGLALGRPGHWPGPVPAGWEGFAARGLCPAADGLRLVFRAITPPGRPRRFDARFSWPMPPVWRAIPMIFPPPAMNFRICTGSAWPRHAASICPSSPRWFCRKCR